MITGFANISRQLSILTGVFLWGALVAFCSGCSEQETPKETVKTGKVLAKVFDEKLYESDVTAMIPEGLTSEDSLLRAQNIINSWVQEKLEIHKAQTNLSKDQQDVEQQLQAYKNSLIIYAYEKELVRQKLDTIVSDEEIEQYYNDHPNDFELKDNIVRVVYVKVDRKSPNQQKIPNWIKSDKVQDRTELESYCRQFAENYFTDDKSWLLFDDVLKEVPIETYNKELFLQNNRYVTVADSSNNYYVSIRGFMTRNSHSPLAFETENIRNIILNQRKKELIDQMHDDIYKEAMETKDVEIYQ